MKKYKYNKSAGGLFNGTKEINTQPNSLVANISKNNMKNSTINSSGTASSSTTQELMSKYNSFKKKINLKYVLIIILILVILCIIIYIVICYVYYNNIICYEKKPFFDYLFSFSNNEVCLVQNKPLPEVPVPLPPAKNKFEINIIPKKEVYHIANQDYTYEQAKCKCESYGGELASKAQITDAYNNGANWCTYGWSDKQSAYYPVQKCDWDKLTEENQRLPEHAKKFCGLPGINGGYFANPSIRFGANCYGIKPKGELNKPKPPFCKPQNFCSLQKNFEASHKLDTDEISPFNSDKWSSEI
jgi:predicted nucleic acid-binding Zn ribbon protein